MLRVKYNSPKGRAPTLKPNQPLSGWEDLSERIQSSVLNYHSQSDLQRVEKAFKKKLYK